MFWINDVLYTSGRMSFRFLRNNWILLGIIVVIAVLLRTLYLSQVPTATTYDQLYYILNAQSFLSTGKDISGSVGLIDLLFFKYPAGALAQAELPFILQVFSLIFSPLSLVSAALPNVVLSCGVVILMYMIGKKLFDERTALIVAFLTAINPWMIFAGRTFYEMTPATFFYLAGFYTLLVARKWSILFSLPLFLLAFYSYIGTKIILIPFLFVSVFYCYFVLNKRKYLLQYGVLLGVSILFVLFYALQLVTQPDHSRLGDIFLPTHPSLPDQVNEVRKLSLQSPFTSIFENKYTLYFRMITSQFLNIFNPLYLFVQGDTFFSQYRHGLFYLLDVVFLLVGSIALFIRKKVLFRLITSFILLATIPQVIHYSENPANFAPHITLLFPFVIFVIGVGISTLIMSLRRNKRQILTLSIFTLYIISLLHFMNIYLYQFPLQTGIFDSTPRVLTKYLSLHEEKGREVIVYSTSQKELFMKYLFYGDNYARENAAQMNKNFNKENFINKTSRITSCPHENKIGSTSATIIVDAHCEVDLPDQKMKIVQLRDNGHSYYILQDKICQGKSTETYISRLSLHALDIEKLNDVEFCKTFILH